MTASEGALSDRPHSGTKKARCPRASEQISINNTALPNVPRCYMVAGRVSRQNSREDSAGVARLITFAEAEEMAIS